MISMHLQSTHTLHSQHLRSDPHLEPGWKSLEVLFCRSSLHGEVVGCFYREAALLMFDRVQNATLSEEKVSTNGVTQGNLELLLPPNSSLIHTKHKYNKMKSWTDFTSSFPWRRTHPFGIQGKKCVINSWAAAHKIWVVRYSGILAKGKNIILWRTLPWIFENVEKTWKHENIHFTTNIYIFGSQTFWSFMKLCIIHIVKVCFVFKKQSLCLFLRVCIKHSQH